MRLWKSMWTFCLFFIVPSLVRSQESSSDTSQWYDFWVGEWDLTWDEGNGVQGKGTNHIEFILDGKVIQEHFQATEGGMKGYKGTSLSVMTPQKVWKQAWADNQGGYFDFTGGINENGHKIFHTQMVEKNGKQLQSRMVFYDIKPNTMTWDWEATQDGGKTWKLNWRIHYQRKM